MAKLGFLGGRSAEEKFWEWFMINEDRLFHFENDQDRVFEELAKSMSKVHKALTFEFGPVTDGKREFVISADGDRKAFPSVESLHSRAPVAANWLFTKFRPRRDPMDLKVGSLTLHSSDLYVALRADGDKVGLTVYGRGYKGDEDTPFKHAAFLMLDQAIGEYDMETKVGFIKFEVLESSPSADKVSLDRLPKTFDDFVRRR